MKRSGWKAASILLAGITLVCWCASSVFSGPAARSSAPSSAHPQSAPPEATPGSESNPAPWPVFRGTPAQKAVVDTVLPAKLETIWSVPLGDGVEATPVHDGQTIFIGTLDNKFLAINLKDGKPVWTQKTGPIKAPACIVGDLVVVGDADGKICAFAKKDGALKWSHDSMAEITGGPNTDGEVILQGTHDNTLFCFEKSGAIRWKFPMEGPFYGTPAIAGGKTFAAGCDSTLHIIDIKTGKETGSVMLNGQTGASAGLDGELLFVGTMSKEIQAIRLKEPKADWTYSATTRPGEFRASPAISQGIVVAGSRDKRVHAVEAATGKFLWSHLTGAWVDGSTVIAADKAIVPSLDGNLYILDLKKGTLIQKVVLDGPLAGSPAMAANRILIASDRRDDKGGTLFCLGMK